MSRSRPKMQMKAAIQFVAGLPADTELIVSFAGVS
jgi:hypothetical protein